MEVCERIMENMAYIFMDESGDLGFDFSKQKTSKYFVVTFLFVTEKRSVEKIVKKEFKGLSKKEIRASGGVLHFHKLKSVSRKRVLKRLAQKDVNIIAVYLDKSKVYAHLQNEKHLLYNYITNILLDRICTKNIIPTDEPVELIASQRETSRFLNNNFCTYLEQKTTRQKKLDISVTIKTPHQEKCLQLVDGVSWALFRKREHGDDRYARIIQKKIVEEKGLF